MEEVPITPFPLERFEAVLDPHDLRRFAQSMERATECFAGRTLWCVNSTAKGGGVAEILGSTLGYLAGAGIDVRWLVIEGDDDFFTVTKRIHNRLHGHKGDGGELGPDELRTFEEGLAPDARALGEALGGRDLAILHDPQPAGLIPAAKRTGAGVVWRCHVGTDEPDDVARTAWDFLRPCVREADAWVFSRRAYAWEGLEGKPLEVIAPCIDAFSPKNQALDEDVVGAILEAAGILSEGSGSSPEFTRQDGSPATVSRTATMIEDRPLSRPDRLVVQVSRWDRLKDPLGVMAGFAQHVPERTGAHLVLAGPRLAEVPDDPEEDEVLRELVQARDSLPETARVRVHLASLPMEDDEENSAIVNALQRRADVVVQKSLAEGFGLTVAEAMWKERPVVASRVGGIQDQIEHGRSGLMVDDPEDLEAFGRAVTELLDDRERAEGMGRAAHQRVCDEFLLDRTVRQYVDLVASLAG